MLTFPLLSNVKSIGSSPETLTAKVKMSLVLSCTNEVSVVEVTGTEASVMPSKDTLTPSKSFSSQMMLPFLINPNFLPPKASKFTPALN